MYVYNYNVYSHAHRLMYTFVDVPYDHTPGSYLKQIKEY